MEGRSELGACNSKSQNTVIVKPGERCSCFGNRRETVVLKSERERVVFRLERRKCAVCSVTREIEQNETRFCVLPEAEGPCRKYPAMRLLVRTINGDRYT